MIPATERGVRAILRRMVFLAPGLTAVRGEGMPPDVLSAAARREGLEVDPEAPGEVQWRPGTTYSGKSTARVIAVVARAVADAPLPQEASRRRAQTYIPLRDWVQKWFAGGPAGRWAARLLVSPAVGDRPTRVPLPGETEWIFTAEAPERTANAGGGWRGALVTGCGCGFFPLMPATLASAAMVPVGLLVWGLAGWGVFWVMAAALAVLAILGSVWLEDWAGRWLLAEDPREFVLDEFAGLAVAWMFLPPSAPWWGIVLAFLAFRVFDIFKWGVDWVEALPIRGRIVWDDVLAGVYAGAATWGVLWLLAWFE